MKKVIFISALALAAAVSCNKSEIVDTKFNEQISFESYVGRDAMTKATPATLATVNSVEVYGYYLGSNPTWGDDSKANLWNPLTLAVASNGAGTVPENQKKYWANDADNYTFLAYAPKADGTVLKVDEAVAENVDGQDPVLTYKVPQTPLSAQHDLLYAKKEGTASELKSGVVLNMQHALARLTVKASAKAYDETTHPFTFHVKEVSIEGPFKTTGNFNLYSGTWDSNAVASDDTKYTFHTSTDAATATNGLTSVDYSGTTTAEGTTTYGNNYLMMIPTNFNAEGAEPAKLYVKYTTFYAGQESTPIEKTFDITTDFVQGKAYSIDLEFSHVTTEITFTVTVEDWKNVANEVADPDNETTTDAGNPNGGTGWTEI